MYFNFTNTFSYFITDGPCTAGYLLQSGDIIGHGIGENLASSVEECANWCTQEGNCCVFEYSPSTKKCQLHKDCHSNHAQYGDFMFCRKFYIGTYTYTPISQRLVNLNFRFQRSQIDF